MMPSEFRMVLIFRGAVIMNAALLISLLLWDWLWTSDLSLVRLAITSEGEGSVWPLAMSWWIYVLYPLVSLFSYAGLLIFSNFARVLFLVLVLFGLIWSTGDGLAVTYGYESFASIALGILDGVVLALAYLSPLSERFQNWSNRTQAGVTP